MDYLNLVLVALLLTIIISVVMAVIGAAMLTAYELIKERNIRKSNKIITKEQFKKSKSTLDNLKDLD